MTTIALIHASPAALAPVGQFYRRARPEWRVLNLLDDGVMDDLRAGNTQAATTRLADLVEQARTVHGADCAVLTCSAVPPEAMPALRARVSIPTLKIDEPMAQIAARAGRRIGVIVTFAASAAATRALLHAAALGEERTIELDETILPEAYEALLSGQQDRHDRIVAEAALALAARGCDALVFSQVSMAGAAEQAKNALRAATGVSIPMLTSLDTSFAHVVKTLSPEGPGT